MNLLSNDHVAEMLGLGKKEVSALSAPVAEAPVSTSDIVGAPETPRPKFTLNPGPIDPLYPWKGIDCDDHFQTYVTRDDTDVPVLIEILSLRAPDGIDRRWAGEPMDSGEVNFGNCFTLHGGYIDLEPEELERIEREFRG